MSEPETAGPGDGRWARLRRRKVVQWAIAYLAATWGFLQALQYLSETYDWPPQLRKLAVPVLLLGLPIVVVLAWYHGDRGHQRVTRAEFAILALLVALGGGIVWRYYGIIDNATTVAASAAQGRDSAGAARPVDDPRPSIAVLPFENRSSDPDAAYFVDGIQDDILTQLTKVRGLRVIASTSVEKLRGTSLSAREIGQRLGVTKLLQGRVQRAGDRVRINVLLVDAATESQDWAERYDRDLTRANVLAIQSEVAATVAARLKTGLPATELAGPEAAATRNLEAWEAYQRGRNSDDLAEQEQDFRRAIEADPRFAPAYVGLSGVLVRQIYASGARRDVNLPEAEAAVDTALQLDPKSAEAWVASADFALDREGVAAAEAKLRKAIELNPNYAHAYERMSDMLREVGRTDEAIRYAKQGVALDPLAMGIVESLAQSYEQAGQFDAAEVQYRRMLEIDPEGPHALLANAVFDAYVRGRFARGVTLLEKAVKAAPDDAFLPGQLALMYMDLGDDSRAAELLDAALNRWPDRTNVNVVAGWFALYRGDQLAAVRYARKALETSPQNVAAIIVLNTVDFARGDGASVLARWALAFPEFMNPVPPELDRHNAGLAIITASILIAANDNRARARVLLDRAERVIRTMPRLGGGGHGIDDAWIDVLRGEKAAAVRALGEAVKAGWRGPVWSGQLLIDRNMVPLRGDPAFQAVIAEIRRDMVRQRAELEKQRGNAAVDPGPAATAR